MTVDILYFADYWDDMWRRRQQLAWHLARSDRVDHLLYIERPLPITSFLKFLVGRADRDGTDRWRRVLRNHSWLMLVQEKLSVLTTFAPLPPVGLARLFQASERARDRWVLRRLLRQVDLTHTVVWVSHPQLSVDVIKALQPRLLCYDCTEDFSAIPGLPQSTRAQIKATDRWLTQHADLVTAVSRTLYEEKRQVNINSHWLPNGVETGVFLRPVGEAPVPSELAEAASPILAFVGGLNDWAHDWRLLDRVATLRPGWTIVLIGHLSVSRQTMRMVRSHPSIICAGQKPYSELPAYLAQADVCFQFYRPTRANDSRCSQKLFLYLAAGKPVVSTPSADVQLHGDLVTIVDTAEEFVRAAEHLIADESPMAAAARREAARQSSWKARGEGLLRLLGHSSML